MNKYIKGFFKNLRNPAVSSFAFIDNKSEIDRKAKLYQFTKVFDSNIGKYSYIGRRTEIAYTEIGHFCSIAGECHIGMGIHTLENISTSPIFTEKHNGTGTSWCNNDTGTPYKKTIIGNDVWIGLRAMVLGGVNIGDGAVIAAGAIVTKDVPPYAIVAGVPARIIRYRFSPEIIKQLEYIKWWELPEDVLQRNIELFQKDNLDFESILEIKETLKHKTII